MPAAPRVEPAGDVDDAGQELASLRCSPLGAERQGELADGLGGRQQRRHTAQMTASAASAHPRVHDQFNATGGRRVRCADRT